MNTVMKIERFSKNTQSKNIKQNNSLEAAPDPTLIDFSTGTFIGHETPHPESAKKRTYYSKEKGKQAVQPLKSKEQIQQAKDYFLSRPERYKNTNLRDYTIFVLGINLARRAGDLLHLRWHNVLDENHNIKSHICINEQKTSKSATIIINNQCQKALNDYMTSITKDGSEIDLKQYIFVSRSKDRVTGELKAMTVKNFYLKLQELKEELNIKSPIGTHTMRKTSGYHILRDSDNIANPHVIAQISKMYGHDNIESTFHYLGIEQEEKDALMMKYEF